MKSKETIAIQHLQTQSTTSSSTAKMSTSMGDDKLHLYYGDWLKDSTFNKPAQYMDGPPVITTVTTVNPDSVKGGQDLRVFHSAFDMFELEGAISKEEFTYFKNGSLFITVPGYHRFKVLGNMNGILKNQPFDFHVKCGKLADGLVELLLEDDQTTVSMSWNINVQFAGNIKGKTSFFSLKEDMLAKMSENSAKYMNHGEAHKQMLYKYYSSGEDVIWFKNVAEVLQIGPQYYELNKSELGIARESGLQAYQQAQSLVEGYIRDHYDPETGHFKIETYRQRGKTSDGPTGESNSQSKTYTCDVSFLEVFNIQGAIQPTGDKSIGAKLNIKLPVVGRIKIAALTGSLASGEQLTFPVKVGLANGSVGLILESKVMSFFYDLDVHFLGKLGGPGKKVKLFTLPF